MINYKMETIQYKQIEILKKETLKFLKTVKEQNDLIIEGLKKHNISNFYKIIEKEVGINKKYVSLFKRTVYEFALINAYGEDLRSIISCSYINYELERIADYTKDTAFFLIKNSNFEKESLDILRDLWSKLIPDFEKIKELLLFSKTKDVVLFLKNRKKKELDYDLINNLVLKIKIKNSELFLFKLNFFFQLKTISRVYDRLTNISEWILFQKSFVKFKEYQKNN